MVRTEMLLLKRVCGLSVILALCAILGGCFFTDIPILSEWGDRIGISSTMSCVGTNGRISYVYDVVEERTTEGPSRFRYIATARGGDEPFVVVARETNKTGLYLIQMNPAPEAFVYLWYDETTHAVSYFDPGSSAFEAVSLEYDISIDYTDSLYEVTGRAKEIRDFFSALASTPGSQQYTCIPS